MKYQKIPVIIDAWHFGKEAIPKEAGLTKLDRPAEWRCPVCGNDWHSHMSCPALEGEHIVCHYDYIIKGIAGEFYPCKPDIFEKTYREISNRAPDNSGCNCKPKTCEG